jgi:hypothetical protein
MKINSINYSLYAGKEINNKSNKAVPAFNGEDKNGENSVYSDGKISRALAALAKICKKNTEPEEVRARKMVPYVLDFALLRADAISKKQAALTLRYGNTGISIEKPEIVEKAKANLEAAGIDVINGNLKLMKVADSDKERYVYKRITYYDEASKKSIVFNPQGDFDYKVSYKYSPNGDITDFDLSEIYTNNKWEIL